MPKVEWGFSIVMVVYQRVLDGLTSANDSQLALQNGHGHLIFPLNMGIFHSYGSLPEGTGWMVCPLVMTNH